MADWEQANPEKLNLGFVSRFFLELLISQSVSYAQKHHYI